jgi:hypothetical protein
MKIIYNLRQITYLAYILLYDGTCLGYESFKFMEVVRRPVPQLIFGIMNSLSLHQTVPLVVMLQMKRRGAQNSVAGVMPKRTLKFVCIRFSVCLFKIPIFGLSLRDMT